MMNGSVQRNGERFDPRSREGSDSRRRAEFGIHSTVSIHAPAKGATFRDLV